MITFYYNLAPNPMKVALCLEEMELAYDPVPVDTRKGEQHTATFREVNPNAKVPVIVDGGSTVFDSNAILLYLAEKTGRFVPEGLAAHGTMFSWLMFIASGIGPYSGQAVHFRHFAPEPKDYSAKRYAFEAKRHWDIIEQRLGDGVWMLGADYSIVDMALWGWARMVPFIMGNEKAMDGLPNLARFMDAVNERPATAKVLALREKHKFQMEMDEAARRNMFPHLAA